MSVRCVHYVGFWDHKFLIAYRVFGGPRIIIDDIMIQIPLVYKEQGHPYDPMDFIEDNSMLEYGAFNFKNDNPPDWKRTKFISGPEMIPSEKKRAMLKAKRKK